MENWNEHVIHVLDNVVEKIQETVPQLVNDPDFLEVVKEIRTEWVKLGPSIGNKVSPKEFDEMKEWLELNQEVKDSLHEKL